MPQPTGIRALVLAAGQGVRLRPLTLHRPKPLLPIAGRPILAHTLDRLAELGCEATAINLFHLGDQIQGTFGTSFRGMPLVYSHERELLGTLGALAPLAGFFRHAELILLINGDSLCAWPLTELVERHREGGAPATVLLAEGIDPEEYGGGAGIDAEGRILSFRHAGPALGVPVSRHVFAGAHAISPAFLSRVELRPADIVRELYEPFLLRGGVLRAVVSRQPWHDLGTRERYLAGARDWLQRTGAPFWTAADAAISPMAELEGSMVECGAKVGRGARVLDSILLPGSEVGEGATVERSILDGGARIAPGETVHDEIISR